MKYVFIALIRFYQKCISPSKPSCCRFIPTCSAYAIEAFKTRGAFIGFGLTFWRIVRCNPFCKGGYDPVPLSRRMKRKSQILDGTTEKDTHFLSDKAHGRK